MLFDPEKKKKGKKGKKRGYPGILDPPLSGVPCA